MYKRINPFERTRKMSRSTYTNAFIKTLYANKDIGSVIVHDGEEDHNCPNVESANEVIDSVDEVQIVLEDNNDKQIGWFMLIMCNDDDEQLSDYTANDLCEKIVKDAYAVLEQTLSFTHNFNGRDIQLVLGEGEEITLTRNRETEEGYDNIEHTLRYSNGVLKLHRERRARDCDGSLHHDWDEEATEFNGTNPVWKKA